MRLDSNIKNSFYQKLGSLFYAIAAADKVVHPEEVKTLRKLILEKWKATEDYKDHFGSDVVYQMEIVFDWLEYNKISAHEGFEEFKYYYNEHKEFFTRERKELIHDTAAQIARSYADVNKSELIMLSKLETLFDS